MSWFSGRALAGAAALVCLFGAATFTDDARAAFLKTLTDKGMD